MQLLAADAAPQELGFTLGAPDAADRAARREKRVATVVGRARRGAADRGARDPAAEHRGRGAMAGRLPGKGGDGGGPASLSRAFRSGQPAIRVDDRVAATGSTSVELGSTPAIMRRAGPHGPCRLGGRWRVDRAGAGPARPLRWLGDAGRGPAARRGRVGCIVRPPPQLTWRGCRRTLRHQAAGCLSNRRKPAPSQPSLQRRGKELSGPACFRLPPPTSS